MKPEEHPKGWGKEMWIANTKYCGKKMWLFKGKKCSVHYHKNKEETFFIQSGKMECTLWPEGYPGPAKKLILGPNDTVHLEPGMIHQFIGIDEETEFFEFSTHHEEEDSYRLAPGDSQTSGMQEFVKAESPSSN